MPNTYINSFEVILLTLKFFVRGSGVVQYDPINLKKRLITGTKITFTEKLLIFDKSVTKRFF